MSARPSTFSASSPMTDLAVRVARPQQSKEDYWHTAYRYQCEVCREMRKRQQWWMRQGIAIAVWVGIAFGLLLGVMIGRVL